MNKLSIISSFLGRVRNRFVEYRGDRTFREKVELAASIVGLDGLELAYPADFEDPATTRSMMSDHGLGVSSVNFRSRRTGKWWRGSLSSEIAEERAEVVEDFKRCIDMAAELGCTKVTTCPLNEGSDYLFEMDYQRAFGYFEETIRAVAMHRPDMNICLEYKLSDPRGRAIMGTAGETLAFCEQVGLPNIGLTLDIGHSLYAGERPAQALVLAHRSNRLFHVHLNDNDKAWDWDMLPGAYNIMEFLEFYYYLDRVGYDDWIAFDIFPKELDTAETFSIAIELTHKLRELAGRIDENVMSELLTGRNPHANLKYVMSLLG